MKNDLFNIRKCTAPFTYHPDPFRVPDDLTFTQEKTDLLGKQLFCTLLTEIPGNLFKFFPETIFIQGVQH
jgi:hypothetical protein